MIRTPVFVRGTAIALALCFANSPSFAAEAADTPSAVEQRAESLKPGQWVWRPELANRGPIQIVVSLPRQLAFVFRGDTLIGATTVSTGMPGYDTPTGRFNILQKREQHFSNLYDNAPMPFMQRLTWDGIALHAGAIPGEPASHGCVRLPKTFAAKLYAATQLGATVLIVDEAPSAEAAYAMVSGKTFGTAMGGPEEAAE